ncbi:unnamed protein product, partial [Rotaria socialis]
MQYDAPVKLGTPTLVADPTLSAQTVALSTMEVVIRTPLAHTMPRHMQYDAPVKLAIPTLAAHPTLSAK